MTANAAVRGAASCSVIKIFVFKGMWRREHSGSTKRRLAKQHVFENLRAAEISESLINSFKKITQEHVLENCYRRIVTRRFTHGIEIVYSNPHPPPPNIVSVLQKLLWKPYLCCFYSSLPSFFNILLFCCDVTNNFCFSEHSFSETVLNVTI
jgi:hypothetical protein